MGTVTYKYATLDDFVLSSALSVEGVLDDGWGASFPVKGVETVAAIMFADISGFTRRTHELSPTETLIFVNNFFAWITAEGLRGGSAIIDKYIGDEIMVVFSRDFGSEDPFLDALIAARGMAERDALSFCPHMGIAYGLVTCGFVGTPLRYDCSVFGAPVNLAKRCATVPARGRGSSSIMFPAELWKDRSLPAIFPGRKIPQPDGSTATEQLQWELLDPRVEDLKNIGNTEVVEIAKTTVTFPGLSAEDRARQNLQLLREAGLYRPRQIVAAPKT
jgi:class 3 adenylate cyclase